MSRLNTIEALGDWQGYCVGTVQRFEKGEKGDSAQIWVELVPYENTPLICSGCLSEAKAVHDERERWIRDLPAWGAETHLLVHRRRVRCKTCGIRVEHLSWLDLYCRMTSRLAESVARLCEVLPLRQVAEYYGLSWDAVKRCHKEYLRREFGEIDFSDVSLLGVDEFAIRKGHRYATVVVDVPQKRVLWVGHDRTEESFSRFFQLLGEKGCQQIDAVAMDMWEPYENTVNRYCPQAEIVYDLFHIVAKFGREVIDRVRVDEANRVRKDKKARKVIKGSRWLLLRNEENIVKDSDRIRLQELLKANRKLMTVYVLKDDLKHLWSYTYMQPALDFWDQWYSRAIRSRIEPLKKFARMLKSRLHGILSHCRYKIGTSLLEGINNKIKVIKRMAYGFRDDEYFFLRIRSAFP